MTLFQSWKESLVIFLPASLKLFLLVTLKSLLEAYKTFFMYFWPLAGVYLFVDTIIGPFGMPLWLGFGCSVFVSTFMQKLGFLHIPLYLSIRTSVLQKNYRYFVGYGRYILYGIVWLIFFTVSKGILAGYIGEGYTYQFYRIFMSATSMFFILFLLDSDGTISSVLKSVGRAVSMTVYNLPFVLIAWAALKVGFLAFCFTLRLLPIGLLKQRMLFYSVSKKIAYLLLLPIPACIMTNFYIKRLHEQFGVYYEVKG